MLPRFVGRIGLADTVTIANAVLGFAATVLAFTDPFQAARLVLLAAVADGLDGLLARRYGGTPVGPHLDSLADVVSFAIAPAAIVFVVLTDGLGLENAVTPELLAVAGLCGLFVAMAVTRLGLYSVYDVTEEYTEGVQTTLAATVIGAAVLAGLTEPAILAGLVGAFCYLMVSRIQYPDLLPRDVFIMGVVHVLAILVPTFAGRTFPWALLTLGVGYIALGPWLYWRDEHFLRRWYGNA